MNAPQLPAFDLRATTRAERLWLCLLALVTLGAVVLGWQIFLFFTDAAYASFRYISNARAS